MLSFIRGLSVFSSTLLACIILFIFISCFMGINPVSLRSIVVGVPCGRFIVVFMPPPLGAGGIMFSGCPSVRPSVHPSVRPPVRSLKYPLLTCTWVRWSTRPTVTVLRHVRPSACPSVRPERFPGICRRMHGGIGLKFYMLMYLDHLENWLVYGYGLLIFLILALFWLSETGQIWGFRAFPG